MNFFDNLMAPLGKEHCLIYYYLGIFILLFSSVHLILGVIKLFDKKNRQMGILFIINSLYGFFSYYLYRIIYSICIKTL